MVPCPQCGTCLERRLVDPPPKLVGFRKAVVLNMRSSRKPRKPPPPQILSDHPRCACGLFQVRLEDTGWLWAFGRGREAMFYLRTGRSVRTHQPRWAGFPGEEFAKGTEGVREAIDRVVCSLVLSS